MKYIQEIQSVKELTSEYYSFITNFTNWLKKHWNIKFCPKNYKNYKKEFNVCDKNLKENNLKQCLSFDKEFNTLNNFNFSIQRLTDWNIVYGEIEQNNPKTEVLFQLL